MFSFFSSTPSVSVLEAFRKVSTEKTVLIDVRETGEYATGHAKSAINMPLSHLSNDSGKELLKKEEVLVICQSGGRSMRATTFLRDLGVNAVNVEGGTTAWKANNLPME